VVSIDPLLFFVLFILHIMCGWLSLYDGILKYLANSTNMKLLVVPLLMSAAMSL
jgi:hypothetical protein